MIGMVAGAVTIIMILLVVAEEGFYSEATIERWLVRSRWRAGRPTAASQKEESVQPPMGTRAASENSFSESSSQRPDDSTGLRDHAE